MPNATTWRPPPSFTFDCRKLMPFSKLFVKGALGAGRGLVTFFKGQADGSQRTSKVPRVSGVDARRGLGGRNHIQKAEPNFVVLIFIKYKGWVCVVPGSSVAEKMQLNSVENDLAEVLRYIRYLHSDTKTMWRLLIDFDLKYTDEEGNTAVLKGIKPTKPAILNALKEAGESGRSGLVYFGGHGEYKPRGSSVLHSANGQTRYSVAVDPNVDPEAKSSFLLAIDGGRIYGKDIISRLPEEVSGKCIHTVAIDACHSAGVTSTARNLLHVYDGRKLPNSRSTDKRAEIESADQGTSKHLVIISAAREGELATTVRPNPKSSREFGRLTWYMLHWLTKFPHAEAQNLSERLEYVCADLPKKLKGPEQHPAISSSYPLEGPFEILPGLYMQHQDDGESSVFEDPERTFARFHWFRPPRLLGDQWTLSRVPRRRAAAAQ